MATAAQLVEQLLRGGPLVEVRKPPKYGHVGVLLPAMVAKTLWTWTSSRVKDSDVYARDGKLGREKDPHVTVKWGFTSPTPPPGMHKLCQSTPPFVIHLGPVSLFKGDEFDVLKLTVTGSGLTKLHAAMDQFENEDQRSVYSAHATLAYVKPGSCDHLVGEIVVPQEFSLVVVDQLRYKASGGTTVLKLKSPHKSSKQ